MDNEYDLRTSFENALANLQYVLIARRVLASDEPMRLNWKHFDIMALIKKRKSLTPSLIGEVLHLSRSSTSKYLRYLEEKGLIGKTLSKTDGRSHQVILTALADGILENIYKGQRKNAALAARALSHKEIEQFTVIAQKITAALDSDTLHTV